MSSQFKNIFQNLAISLFAGVAGAYGFSYFSENSAKKAFQNDNQNNLNQQITQQNTPNVRNTGGNDGLGMLIPSEDFVTASSVATQSVVYIKSIANGRQNVDMFEYMFGGGGNQGGSRVTGSGSGVIFTADGYIITNNHVIDGADKLEVIHEKRSYEAKVIGRDPSSDLAILKIEAKNLPNAKLGRSRDVKVGEWVLAVGNPFNLTSTVTAGIVSAKGRNIKLLNSQFPIESFIQTDAAINPGNSGGALVNIKGELIGINTAILSYTGSYSGYGFAVPVDIVAKIARDLIQFGDVQKAFLGAEVQEVNNESVKEFALKGYDGVLVTSVQDGTAAATAGLKRGDVILKLDNDKMNSRSDYDEKLSYAKPGDKINITFKRNNIVQEKLVELINREGNTAVVKKEVAAVDKLGVEFEALSKIDKDKLKLKGGVRISKVKRGGIFFRETFIQEGFVITKINEEEMSTADQTAKKFEDLMKTGGRVLMEGFTADGSKGYYQFYF